MSNETMKVTVPLTILTLVVTIVCGIIGWTINDKLSNIYQSISEVKSTVEKLSDVRYDHETRLKIIENELKLDSKKNKNESK